MVVTYRRSFMDGSHVSGRNSRDLKFDQSRFTNVVF